MPPGGAIHGQYAIIMHSIYPWGSNNALRELNIYQFHTIIQQLLQSLALLDTHFIQR